MATFGKGVEYALHCLDVLSATPGASVLTIKDLAEFQGVSESYLAKVFTKLTKAGLTRSSVGAKGGYELARSVDQITFWDVVVALEGEPRLFECRNIRSGCVLYRDDLVKLEWLDSDICEIHRVMLDAEAQVKAVLQKRTLAWLAKEVKKKIPDHELRRIAQWFQESVQR